MDEAALRELIRAVIGKVTQNARSGDRLLHLVRAELEAQGLRWKSVRRLVDEEFRRWTEEQMRRWKQGQ